MGVVLDGNGEPSNSATLTVPECVGGRNGRGLTWESGYAPSSRILGHTANRS